MDLNVFGENVRVGRRALGWTQTRLAEELGISRMSVMCWETGRKPPKLDRLLVLADMFAGGSVDRLLGRVTGSPKDPAMRS
jgi:transcriptional regulator with XRE-family HTH domain